jgi:hypothetical protein|tara:strand:- start:37 stop:381 length:345 start_codon:yes stop_codon:yes gene_type:complete
MIHKGTCHCKSVEFEIVSDLDIIKQCNCSICIRKNAKMAIIPIINFKLLKGKEFLTIYQFNKNIAKHFFCKKCGIYTHHNTRSDDTKMGVNIGCVDEIDFYLLDTVLANGKKLS